MNIVGIVLCVILALMLAINCTLFIKGIANRDEVPSFLGISPMIVLTGSMEQDFPAGSLILTKKADISEIKEGDIISYFDPSSTTSSVVTHKVKLIKTNDKGETIFCTYGTANVKKPFEDITETDCEEIPGENLIGRYTGIHFAGLGTVAMFMQSTAGLIVCVLIPLVILIEYNIIRRRMYEKKHQGDKEELMRELEELRKLKDSQSAPAETDETMTSKE